MNEYSNISVLCVEDEIEARELLLSSLEQSFPGLKLHSASNGLEGLELCRIHHPRILLTDILMPGINGIEMSAEIRRIAPEMVIIVMSAHSEADYLLKAIEIGVDHFILKPVNLSQLLEIINRSITTIRLKDQVRIQTEQIGKLSKAVEQSPITVIITDTEGKIEYVNPKFSSLTGYTPEEAIGKNPRMLKSGLTDPDVYKDLWNAISSGREWQGEFLNRKKNDELYWEAASISPLFGSSGEITSYIAVKEDVTQRKNAELEIKELNRILTKQAEDLAAANNELEAFNYTVAHDLRSPLTVVGGFAQLLLSRIDPGHDPESGYLETICKTVARMEELIDSLLGLSRITHREMELTEVNLSTLASRISLELKVCDPERKVLFSIADNITCKGDQKLLSIVLENLLGNAWKYTSRRDKAFIEFGATELDGSIAFMVRDNGAGFDGRKADDLFRCFYRLHGNEEFSGHGIGLATVKRIIDRHDGTIRAEGEIDSGATFYVTLPTLQKCN